MKYCKIFSCLILLAVFCVACGGGGSTPADPTPTVLLSGTGGQVAISVLEIGEYVQLSATTVNAVDSSYFWQSSNPAVATVSASGTVQTLQAGVVTISVVGNDTGATGQCEITVITYNPILALWQASKHADITRPAFTHFNADQQIPVACAKCHSTPGFLDYLGADASTALFVDSPAIIGTVVTCTACHNDAAAAIDSVPFPSGKIATATGSDSVCLMCHQGLAAGNDVAAEILTSGVGDDTIDSGLNFINSHYSPAGATAYGTMMQGGYQYPAPSYDGRYQHVDGINACVDCHDPHSLAIDVTACATCHAGVTSMADLRNIRVSQSSAVDYDGDADLEEGLYHEIETLKSQLIASISAYVGESAATNGVCYTSAVYPYYFVDQDASSSCEASEAVMTNSFSEWTPRLLRAAYNYHYLTLDNGSYAHNAKYAIQLLYDSIADLDSVLTSPVVSVAELTRNDTGHLDGSSEAARHWDEEQDISSSCSRCHGGSEGYDFFQAYGAGTAVEQQNGMSCSTCHAANDLTGTIKTVENIRFPNAVVYDSGDAIVNLCANCHIGRESKFSVDADIAANNMRFNNPHYRISAAVYFGSDGEVGYQYDTKIYAPRYTATVHSNCQHCHIPQSSTDHTLRADNQLAYCITCHVTVGSVAEIRIGHGLNYDGDADPTEPLAEELSTLSAALLTELQAKATTNGTPICFSTVPYPFFFKDTNLDGSCDTTEINYGNRFTDWTPALMKASFNYTISIRDNGAWAHNFDYMAQLLIDSIEDLGGDISLFTRP